MKKKAQNILFIIPDHFYARNKYDYIIHKITDGHKVKTFTNREIKKRWKLFFYLKKFKLSQLGHVLLSLCLRVTYRPRVIGFFDESTKYSKALKKYSGATVINIAHAVTGDERFYNNIFFDYYFIYGRSSIVNMKNNPDSCINTTVNIIGPIWSEVSLKLEKHKDEGFLSFLQSIKQRYKRIILITSQWTRSIYHKEGLMPNYSDLISFMKNNNDYFFVVRKHPRECEEEKMWAGLENQSNISVRNAGLEGFVAYRDVVDLHITVFSNAAIDLALLNIPTIFFNKTSHHDNYIIKPGSSLLVTNLEHLKELIDKGISASDFKDFVDYNFECLGFNSLDRLEQQFKKIIRKEKVAANDFFQIHKQRSEKPA